MSPATSLRAFYALYYAGVGVTLPYFAPYLRGLGFSGAEIGAVQMLSPLLSGPMALLWAGFADRLGAAAAALRLSALCSLGSLALLPFARAPLSVGAVLLLQGLAAPALVPLVDALTVEWLREARGSYTRIRLFGSLGYVVAAQGMGLLLTARRERAGDLAVPLAWLACAAGYALAARFVPVVPATHARATWRDAARLLRSPPLVALLAMCAVHWAACAPYNLMFGVLVRDRGLSDAVTGAAMAAGVVAEVGVLVAFPRFERLRTGWLFALAFAGTALRWWLVSRAGPRASELVLLQLLHGLTFGLFWACAVRRMSELVPTPLRATGQAIFSAVVFSAGNAAGYFLAGVGYDRFHGVAPLFGIAAAVELAPLALALLTARAPARGAPGALAAP